MKRKPTYEELERKVKELEKEAWTRDMKRKSLLDSEERYHRLFDSAADLIAVIDLEGNFLELNEKFEEESGYNRVEMLGKNIFTSGIISTGSAEKTFLKMQDSLKNDAWGIFEIEGIRKDGGMVPYELRSVPVKKEGRTVAIQAILRNITERKRTEEALLRSEEKYRSILESMQEGYYEVDLEGNHTFFNDSLCEIFGYTREELAGINYRHLNNEENSKRLFKIYTEIYRKGVQVRAFEWEILRRDGSMRYVEASASLMKDVGGEVIGFRGIVRDVTERIVAEKALEVEKEKFRLLVEKSPLGVSLISKKGDYIYVNPKFTEIFGYRLEDVPNGKEWFELAFPVPEYRSEAISAWKSDFKESIVGESMPRIFTVACKDGTQKVISFRTVRMETGDQFITYEDITENRRLEAQFQQAQRMESIGTLAGGIAHDFNNLLTGIIGNVSLILLDLDAHHPHYERLKSIEQYTQSGAELTKQLLGFARGGKYEVRPTNLNDLIEKSSDMFGRTKKEIKIHRKLGKGIWTVEIDRSQIEQVLLNIYVNAWQAMPGGGDLFIQTENVLLDEEDVRPYDIAAGEYVKISITDNGIGMDEDIKERIFEPFFTTKEIGRGTGLGLASAYGIIKNHGGVIKVYSEKGYGSSFSIYLPFSDKGVPKKEKIDIEICMGSERVLLVDDEDVILEVNRQLLEKLGYSVVTAKRGRDAIEIYKKDMGSIDVVILDMIMPEMSGGETYDKLSKINPAIKVLLSSGYSLNGQAQGIMDRGCTGFIQKPFGLRILSQKLRQILDGGQFFH